MTSATTRPASGTGGQVQGGGLVLFAAVMLVVIGCFNLIYGIAAIAHSHVFVANAATCSPTCAPGDGSP